jgi:predicted acyl esterase
VAPACRAGVACGLGITQASGTNGIPGSWPRCHTCRAGHRIQVDVTSSNFPRRARNTNSGNPALAHDSEAAICVATNTVHHAEATPSFIEMPVLTS